MKFALIGGERALPSPGRIGTCPACGRDMVAKCGTQRVHHWAHRGVRRCDPWWEPETQWHRTWKSEFPANWQEVIFPDNRTGEKHIADVHTKHGLTIEFQHSHLRPDERAAREEFYVNMIWVVDGSRLKRDWPRFRYGLERSRSIGKELFLISSPEEAFPRNWIRCAAPVIFDFENSAGRTQSSEYLSSLLWCLLPGRAYERAAVLCFSRDAFVRSAHATQKPIEANAVLEPIR
ncbi:MAG: competence protein CoiA family protein, partial [Rhodobacteraceae bacterium]|nr:competence protein CoiA family protein [Paracoccaceae bacterium]